MMLGLRFFYSSSSTQKEAQVVGGGLVYVAMFRRPLLGGLNAIWEFISSFEGYPPVCRLPIPFVVKLEVVRFLSLFPLAMMNFRPNFDGSVTASDASSSGGGITVSRSLTAFGEEASQGTLRGDVPGLECASQILTIGLFDGIAALRIALGVMSAGHVSVECSSSARRVVESYFPEVITVTDIADVSEELVKGWACRFTHVALVLIGAGPPCQGVSGLNSERKGATRDRRSSLYYHLPRVRALVVRHFPWAQVHSLMESVASMDASDRAIMSESEGSLPWKIDSAGVSLARRPRLYWLSWEVEDGERVDITPPLSTSSWEDFGCIDLTGKVVQKKYLTPGWQKISTEPFPTFTTSRPREYRGPRPAGLDKCSPEEVSRWEEDLHRFPPYQSVVVFASPMEKVTSDTPMYLSGSWLWGSLWDIHLGVFQKARPTKWRSLTNALPSWVILGMSQLWCGFWGNYLGDWVFAKPPLLVNAFSSRRREEMGKCNPSYFDHLLHLFIRFVLHQVHQSFDWSRN